MFPQIRAAFFHLDEHDGLPNIIGKGGAADKVSLSFVF